MESRLIHICTDCSTRQNFSYPKIKLHYELCHECGKKAGGLPMNNIYWYKTCERNKKRNKNADT